MRRFRAQSFVLSLLALLCACPARAAYPVVSTVTVSGSGAGTDVVNGMVQDASGNLFVAGYLTQSGTGSDIWVAKFNSALVQQSSWTYDKAGFTDAASQVALDTTTGNVFVTGFISSTPANSSRDIWIGKFDSSLVLQATVTFNGSGNDWDEGNGIRVSGGIVYVVGHSSVTGGKSHWLGRYTTNLVLLSTTTLTEYDAYTQDVLVNSAGNIFIAGSRAATSLVSVDAWIGKYNSSLVFQSSATVAGSAGNNDSFYRMADDGAGGVYAVGYLNTATAGDRYIVHYDANLVKVSSSLVNGPGNSNEYWQDVVVTAAGTLLLAGDQSEAAGAGGVNALLAEYTTGLALISSTSYRSSSTGSDHASAVLIGTNQDVYAAGYVTEANTDAWLARYSTSTLYGLVPATGFAGVAVSSLSVQWSWTDASVTETGYRVMSGAANVSGDLAANTTTWLQTGLTPNTTAGALFARTFNSSGTADTGSSTVYSLTDPPNSITATFYGSSCAFTWPTMANPAYTRWSVERGTDGVSYASQLYFSSVAAAYTDTAMLGGTTYYYRIRSANQDGVYSSHANSSAIVYTGNGPAQPSGFAGVAQTTTSILWTWADNSTTESGYRVMFGGTNVSGDLPANTTFWLQTGLAVNTSSGALFAQVFNSTGVANSASVTRYSLAAVPGAASAAGVGQKTAAISWSNGSNAAGTVFETERSSGTGFGLRLSGTATSFTETILTPASTYYYRLRALNGDSVASAYTSSVAVVTAPTPSSPLPGTIAPSSGAVSSSVGVSVTGSGFTGTTALTLERTDVAHGTWTATGSFTQGRHTSALFKLRDGRVLLAGGMLEGSAIGLNTVDLYDPATGTWSPGPPLRGGRNQFGSVMLADGRVLVSGGRGSAGTVVATAEIYDPAASTWTAVASMNQVRSAHTMTLLPDGRVLAAGGYDGSVNLASAERYDPATDTWTSVSSMSIERDWAAAVLIGGKVLVAGGSNNVSGNLTAELFDPVAGTWSPAGTMSMARYLHQLVVLPNGKALVTGGGDGGVSNTSELYDPVANTWSSTATLAVRRYVQTQVLIGDQPMIIGGENTTVAHATTEVYDLLTNTWRAGPSLSGTRTWTKAVVLDDGRVLVAGGRQGLGGGTNLNTAALLGAPTAQIVATGVTSPDSAHLNGTLALPSSATGYWDVVARGAGTVGRLTGGFLGYSTPPAVPTGFAGAAQSTSSILWSWTDNATNETGYRLLAGATNVSGDLAANTSFWLQTGLGVNASSGALTLQVFNSSAAVSAGPLTRYSLAAAPGTPAASSLGIAAASLTWTAGGNPGGTTYQIERSTGSAFGLRQAGTLLTFADTALSSASTYYYRVRALNSDLIGSAYSSSAAVTTPPLPVYPRVSTATPSGASTGTVLSLAVGGTGFHSSAVLTLERQPADLGAWGSAGTVSVARGYAPLVKLNDGRALLIGGLVEGSTSGQAEVDVYSSTNNAWSAAAPMAQGRYEHRAVLLADGRVLVTGGQAAAGSVLASCEIYDPVSGAWFSAAPMTTARKAHRTVLLPDGRVLAAGGYDLTNTLSSAEVYDPAANTWTATPAMSANRQDPALILLTNGKVLVSGGNTNVATNASAQLYDPVGNSWAATGSLNVGRFLHQPVLLPDGKVLVTGGSNNGSGLATTAEVYDPATGVWTLTGALSSPRYMHATTLVSGTPIIIGGENGSGSFASTELYDASVNAWRPGPSLSGGRTVLWGAEVLDNGRVLVAGGRLGLVGGTSLNTAELLSAASAQIVATGVAVPDALNLSGTVNLTGAATGYWDVVVRELGGRTGRLPGGFQVLYGPTAPSGFAGTAQSTSSILWSWTDNSNNETGFRVVSGTVNVSGNLAAGTTGWLQTGLGANVLAGPLSAQAFNLSGAANSSAASRTTLAAVPTGLAASGVYQTSGTVNWSANGNAAGTTFELERSTGSGFGLQFSGSATTYFDQYLTPAATHFFHVRAINGEAVATAYSSTLAVVAVAPPAVPGSAGTPVGTALGTSSVTWTWVLAAGATTHNLYRASDNSYLGSSASGPFVQTALSPNVPYGLRAAGVNVGGTGPLSPSATVYTLAAAPSGAAASSSTATSLTLTWGLNGNPAGTTAEVLRSTNAVVYTTMAVVAATTATDADLIGCTTYYYKVRNANGNGLPTAYASFQGVTANTVPSPPSAFTAAANSGGTIGLTWSLSQTEGITAYRLFWDSGSGTVSYAAPLATLGPTAASYTTGVLTSSAAYTFALRAVHRCGVEETTGALAMSGAAVAAPALRAAIKEPDSGKRIHGNRVTILGELIYGTPSDAQQVLFQYKLAASTGWTNVPAANINHPNPDLSFPYFVHWNVNLLAPGDYDLRAVAYNRDGVPDAAPPAVRVSVVATGPGSDIDENDDNGAVKKEQTIANGVTSVIDTAGAGASDPSVRVSIPAGAVNASTATISVTANPAITTAAPAGQTLVGSAIKIDLSNGQSALNGTAQITLTYPDTVLFPSLLQIYYLNEATGQWSRDFASTVDTASRTVTGNTPHFSTFALLLGTSFAANLDSVQVYPVPFKPNGTNADEGRPFSASDPNSGIIFANLAMGSEIKIYTLTGRLVSSLDNAPITGTIRWDARNQDGRDVASGAYFAVIKAAGQKTVVKKLVIIR